MKTRLLANQTDPSARQQAFYAFLAGKERRSHRTSESCARMLQQFLGRAYSWGADVDGQAKGARSSSRAASANWSAASPSPSTTSSSGQ
jgi:hypothetical protein